MTDPEHLSFEFAAGDGKPRLDQFVADQLPKVSLTRIRRLIAEGDVTVNDAPAVKGARLLPGDRVAVLMLAADKSSATPEPIPLEILYEDDALIAVNKPVGLLVHPSRHEKSGTLTNGLAYYFWQTGGEAVRPGIIHRLDRDTSGVIVVAKTARAHRTMAKFFRERRVRKFYLALVSGRVPQEVGDIAAPIGYDEKTWPHWRVMDDGRAAQTHYCVKQRFAAHTLLELEPLTGRTHQLRIHCNLLGHPIVGDPFYATTVDPLVKERQLKHHLLHAARLVFPHPATSRELDLSASVPQAMAALIAGLQPLAEAGLGTHRCQRAGVARASSE